MKTLSFSYEFTVNKENQEQRSASGAWERVQQEVSAIALQ